MKKLFVFLLVFTVFTVANEPRDADGAQTENGHIESVDSTQTHSEIPAEITGEEIAEETPEHTTDEAVENADDETSRAETASLAIITAPDSANVLINRRKSGFSPFFAPRLDAREYNIMLLKDGYELFDTTIILEAGQNDTLSVTLVSEKAVSQTVESKGKTPSKSQQTKEETSQATGDTTAVEDDADNQKKKKKMDMIGIIVFLSVMLLLLGKQEYDNR